ncbi:MAG: DUF2845 domain-containing protein [Lysobacterales bacterium]
MMQRSVSLPELASPRQRNLRLTRRRFFAALALLLFCPFAVADSMSCGVNLVIEGDYKFEVLDACGEPSSKEFHFIDGLFQQRDRHGRRLQVDGLRVDTWTYRFGPQKFTRILRFENNKLVKIEKARRRL